MANKSVMDDLKLCNRCGLSFKDSARVQEAEALLESGKGMMIAVARRFINEAGVCPLLLSYANDGTPLRANHTIRPARMDGAKGRRVGKTYVEVLIHSQWLRYIDHDGTTHSAALIHEPLALSHGQNR